MEQAFTGFVALVAPKSPHEILGVRPNASEEEIDAAYRRKAMAAHPDRGGSASEMAELTEARLKEWQQVAELLRSVTAALDAQSGHEGRRPQ